MASQESHRRLAAIVFTDIAGYTQMMQRDEHLAMSAVRKHHQIIESCIPSHRGHLQQYFGDGSLSIFNSATDAVQCALEIQKQLLEDPEVPVRIGIHIGEIRSEDGKIFGDGVNIASRIESIGQPGTVLFSRDVFEKVRNHTEFQISELGRFEFKNVDDPIVVYALTNQGLRIPDPKKIEGKLKEQKAQGRRRLIGYILGALIALGVIGVFYLFPRDGITSPTYRASIAVLRFENLNPDREEDFIGVGLAEDILTQLAQIQGLKVIARSSSMQYQESSSQQDIGEVAHELGVDHILVGSVRKYGDQFKVTVRLLEAKEERVIWAEEFVHEITDVLNVQHNIAKTVSEKLKVQLTPEVRTRLNTQSNVDADAYVNYLKGQEVLLRSSGSQMELDKAESFFRMSLQADSTFSKAWVGLADANLESVFWHRSADMEAIPKAISAATMALKLDPDLAGAYAALGAVDLFSNNLRSAQQNLQKALTLNPNCVSAYERLAWAKFFLGDQKEAFRLLDQAIQLDPMSTRFKGGAINAYYMSQEYEKGLVKVKDYLRQHPDDNFLLWSEAYLLAGKGEWQEAIKILDRRTLGKGTNWVYAYCYSKLGQMDKARVVLDTLLARDKRQFVPDFMIAVAYNAVGDHDKALDKLEEATVIGGESFFAQGIKNDPMFESLHGNPRFEEVVRHISTIYDQ